MTNKTFSDFVQAFKQEWDKIDGLDVEIDVVQTTLGRIAERDFDLTISAFGGGTPHALVDRLLSTKEATNITGISAPQLDEALTRYLTSDDEATVVDALRDAQAQVIAEMPYIPAHRLIGSNFTRDQGMTYMLLTDGAVDFSSIEVE